MRIPLAVPLQSRDGTVTKDPKTKNAILEVSGEKLKLRKRPGLTDLGLVTSGTAQLLSYWDGEFRTVLGDAIGSGIVSTSPVWNSNDKGANITLSGSNLVASAADSTQHGVRANVSKSSGKWYWEVTVTSKAGSNGCIGLANASAAVSGGGSIALGTTTNSLAFQANGNIILNSNVLDFVSGGFAAGDVISIAYNADAGQVTFRKNNGTAFVISSLPTGALYPAVGGNGNAGITVFTANFGASAFTYSAPSGFESLSLGFLGLTAGSSTALSPTTAGLRFSAQDNGSNAFESLLMVKNEQQAWTVDTSGNVTQITDADYPGRYTVTLTSLTRSGTTATATTAFDTNFQVGSTVTIAGANQADYNGAKVITSVTPSTITGIAADVAVTITRSGTTATATVVGATNPFVTGTTVTISGADQTEYNGDYSVTRISDTQFSYTVSAVVESPTSPATGSPVIKGKQYETYWCINVEDADPETFQTRLKFSWPSIPNIQVGDSIIVESETTGLSGTYTVTSSDIYGSQLEFTVSGFPSFLPNGAVALVSKAGATISSITSTGGVATVTTSAAHGYVTGTQINVSGATQYQYNGPFTITVTSSTTFTYQMQNTVTGTPATPATGTIRAATKQTATGASFTFTVANSPVTPATGTITAAGGRTTVPGIIYLGGRFGVMDEQGVIYNSSEDAPEDWRPLEYFTALEETGAGVAIAKNLNYGVAFKEWSTEFFRDAGLEPPGSPWAPVENLHTLVGCAQGWSVADVAGSLLWIAQEKKQKGRSVYMMANAQQVKVSTPDIDRILNADNLLEVYAFGTTLDGHRLYVLTLEDTGITLVYDLDTKAWGEWSSLTAGSPVSISSITRSGTTATVTFGAAHGLSDGDPVLIAGATQTDYNGIHQAFYVSSTVITIEVQNSPVTPATGTITGTPYTESYFKFPFYAAGEGLDVLLHESDGHLYSVSPSVYLDDEVPVNVHARTQRLDGGDTSRKPMPRVGVIGDSVESFCVIRWSDDDCATFSAYRKCDLSDEEPEIRRCGAFKRRTLELRHVANTALQLEALEL